MTPSYKEPEIERLLEALYSRTTAIKNDRCLDSPIGCGKKATVFKNAIARAEYANSGLCQNCQDKIFKNPTIDSYNE